MRFVVSEAARRVDVFVGGEHFTSYVWPETLKRPVLYPLRAPDEESRRRERALFVDDLAVAAKALRG